MKIAVLGGGSWGTALSSMLAGKGLEVSLLVRDADSAEAINLRHRSSRYLQGVTLHENLSAALDPCQVFNEADLCLLTIPCQSMRAALSELAEFFRPGLPVVCASKGLELGTNKTMSSVVHEVLPKARYAILSGPSFAKEVALGMPTTVSLGCAEKALGEELREIFSCDVFRVYSGIDVIGVEIGGAIKNVMASAAGVSDGLGFGHNA
ncbi:MAG: NAD(P)-binding domain-containing protein, partial [Deltaproteobacteria bacterium]|nr:NAD(P)-binding domain-containing protein [Deltaproteobacteria bacterium]